MEYFLEGDGDLGTQVVALSLEIWMLNLNQLEDDIAGSALHSLIAHVRVPQIRVAR